MHKDLESHIYNCFPRYEATKIGIHIFINCSVATAIWFGSKWSVHIDILGNSYIADIVKMVISYMTYDPKGVVQNTQSLSLKGKVPY